MPDRRVEKGKRAFKANMRREKLRFRNKRLWVIFLWWLVMYNAMRKHGVASKVKSCNTDVPLRDKGLKTDIRVTSSIGWQVKEIHLSIQKPL